MSDSAGRTVLVWDRFVRFFHWSLVILFIVSYLTGDSQKTVHVWSGYAMATLLTARVVWGFAGGSRARLTSFVRGPSEVVSYLRGMLSGRHERYLGHNPLGGWGVLAMLIALLAATTAGMILLAADYGEGPFARWASLLPNEDVAKRIHETLVNGVLVLIVVHLAGVLLHWIKFRENLVPPMIHGRKAASPTPVDTEGSGGAGD